MATALTLLPFICCLALLARSSFGSRIMGTCKPSGYLVPKQYHHCNSDHKSDCCQVGHRYPQYKCSPPLSSHTAATLTLNGFEKGEDGGGPARCDDDYHDNGKHWVALSTGWFDNQRNCMRQIKISARGKSTTATVIDECDAVNGCDKDHDYQPPCENDIVDASESVWKALGMNKNDDDYGYMPVTWEFV